jgi:hypothetical protein
MIEYTVRVYPSGNKTWFLDGKRHREDGPAIEYSNGYKSWYLDGKLHREDGPAIDCSNGDKSWYLNGKKLTEQQHKAATSKPTCEGKIVGIDGKKYKLKGV